MLDKEQAITCGSAVKLRHLGSKFYLNSGEMAWGTGSGQQVVTLGKTKNSSSSLWQVRESHTNNNVEPCITGKAFQCNDIIRLTHVPTKKNLHTHAIPATLTNYEQEISAFGDENGQGDDSDDWKIICPNDNTNNGTWKRNTIVRFQHVITKKYLTSSSKRKFTAENCPNCPIIHHLEVTGSSSMEGNGSNFRAEIGAFINV